MKHISEITEEYRELLLERIDKSKSIKIAGHISPDDDSISSVLAVYYYLTEYKKKKDVAIVYTGTKTSNWEYFKNFDQIVFVDDIAAHLEDTELLILVDGSSWGRFSRENIPDNLRGRVVCIDHHPHPEEIFDLHLVAPQYPAASEIIYRLFFENEKLDSDICEILMMGITGDTGNFRYLRPEQSETLSIAKRLVDEGGVYLDDLKTKYENISEKAFYGLSKMMENSEIVDIDGWPKFMVTFLSREYMLSEGLDDNQIKESSAIFTQYLRAVEGVLWGFILTPRLDNATHMSFRSSPGSVNVNILATVFGGGGHVRASGGKIEEEDVLKAKDKIIDWMRVNKPILE